MTLSKAFAESQQWVSKMRQQGMDIADSAHTKLMHEAQEFAEAPSLEEAADVFIALAGACESRGWDAVDLKVAIQSKMAINRTRQWKQTADGTWQHK